LMTATYTQEQVDSLVNASKKEAFAEGERAATAKMEEKVSEAEKRATEAEGRAERAAEALREFEEKAHKAEIERLVDGAIKDGKLLPKSKDAALAFGLNMPAKIKFGDKEEGGVKMFSDFLNGLGTQVDTSQRSGAG